MKDAVGAPVPRKEDLRLITGRGTFVSDLQPSRTRHVAFLRSNVLLTRTFTAGDTEAALATADLIVERELIVNRHAGNPMECRAGLALWQPERRRLTFGVRGVGEGGTLGPAAALAGAVGDAVGVAVDRLPITPSSLWELMTP